MAFCVHFEDAVQRLLGIEGGYVDDAADSGGATRWGITEAVARRHGYHGKMQHLPLPVAEEIYHERYWKRLNLDLVAAHSVAVADELFEQGVNMGVRRAAQHLQRVLNALNDRGLRWSDIRVDGMVGPSTLAALQQYTRQRSLGAGSEGERVLLAALTSLQGAFYISLAERREKDERFLYGWLLQRVAQGPDAREND